MDNPLNGQFQHDASQLLISQLRGQARYVVIEALDAGDGPDTLAFGGFADAALIAVEASRTGMAELAGCLRRLERLRTPVLGAVLFAGLPGQVTVRAPRAAQPRPAMLAHDGGGGQPREERPPVAAAKGAERAVPAAGGHADRSSSPAGS